MKPGLELALASRSFICDGRQAALPVFFRFTKKNTSQLLCPPYPRKDKPKPGHQSEPGYVAQVHQAKLVRVRQTRSAPDKPSSSRSNTESRRQTQTQMQRRIRSRKCYDRSSLEGCTSRRTFVRTNHFDVARRMWFFGTHRTSVIIRRSIGVARQLREFVLARANVTAGSTSRHRRRIRWCKILAATSL